MNCTLAEFIKISGADVLTLGGTKSGMMFGEAVIFFNHKRFPYTAFNHKRSMQLASKNRFIAAQFAALLEDELWKKIAVHTNELAKYFATQLAQKNNQPVLYPVETNTVFMKMKQAQFDQLQSAANFYRWDDEDEEVRFVFSFSNSKKEITTFFKNTLREHFYHFNYNTPGVL
jgi:threonine aldolase